MADAEPEAICYRVARESDLDACLALEWTRSRDDLRWHVDADLIFVAESGSAIVGYARLESFWRTMPYLALIVVASDHRGCGVGSKLLAFVCAELRRRGYTALLSSTTASEPEPERWHRRNGFVAIGALSALNPGGVDENFFRLGL